MADNEYTPSLTMNPTQAAAQEAPAAPQLTLNAEPEKEPEIEPEKLDIERLAPAEQAAVREFSKQIDVTDTNLVLSYGAAAQKNISEFSGQALNKVRTKDMGHVGDMLANLVVELKGLNFPEEEKKGFLGLGVPSELGRLRRGRGLLRGGLRGIESQGRGVFVVSHWKCFLSVNFPAVRLVVRRIAVAFRTAS